MFFQATLIVNLFEIGTTLLHFACEMVTGAKVCSVFDVAFSFVAKSTFSFGVCGMIDVFTP